MTAEYTTDYSETWGYQIVRVYNGAKTIISQTHDKDEHLVMYAALAD